MAVPSGHHIWPYASVAKQGGTIINNDNTGDVITKALQLNDAVANTTDASTLPSVSGGGGGTTFKPLSGGTFGYSAEGKYVIARSSDTLSGVSNTKLLFMGAGDKLPIARFRGDFGAKLLTAWRQNQFSWLHKLDSGYPITNMRTNWLNAAGTAADVHRRAITQGCIQHEVGIVHRKAATIKVKAATLTSLRSIVFKLASRDRHGARFTAQSATIEMPIVV